MVKQVDRESLSVKFAKLDESPGNYLKLVLSKWEKALQGVLNGLDLTATQLELLGTVANLTLDGKPVTQIDVGVFAHRDKNTVSRVMRALEKKGYVTRLAKDGDMRSKYLTLTDKGFRLVDKAMNEVLLIDERFFVDDGDAGELKRLLKKYL
ncbi:MAG TPA: MarR family transcriptional regulator [Methanocella sp.]|nr:MarR family transcriptional regulator [Methanocella sp.]